MEAEGPCFGARTQNGTFCLERISHVDPFSLSH